MFSKHAESYEKPLHTPEPLIAHLLNPNYTQVMIRGENNFVLTECYDRIRYSSCPLNDLHIGRLLEAHMHKNGSVVLAH